MGFRFSESCAIIATSILLNKMPQGTKTQMATVPKTEEFLDPPKIFKRVGVEQGFACADFGSGSGYICLPLAKYVTGRGKVFAVDVVKDSLEMVHEKALQQGSQNVRTVWADLEVVGGTKITSGSLDMVFLKTVFFQLEKPIDALKEVARVLKKGGKLVVIDWKKGVGPVGPPDELRKDEEEVLADAKTAGFSPVESFPVDKYHFGYILQK